MPGLSAFFTNMSVPMALHHKLYLVFRNNLIKMWKRRGCCGHPGDPAAERQQSNLPLKEE